MSGAKQTTSSYVTIQGTQAQTIVPMQKTSFSIDIVKDAPTLAKNLSSFVETVEKATRGARSQPRNRATIYRGVKFTSGSTTSSIKHGFGVAVNYLIVRWQGAAMYGYSENTNDGSALILNALATGTADLEVWPVS